MASRTDPATVTRVEEALQSARRLNLLLGFQHVLASSQIGQALADHGQLGRQDVCEKLAAVMEPTLFGRGIVVENTGNDICPGYRREAYRHGGILLARFVAIPSGGEDKFAAVLVEGIAVCLGSHDRPEVDIYSTSSGAFGVISVANAALAAANQIGYV